MIEAMFKKENLSALLEKNNIVKLGVFGSYARGEKKETSDMELVVKFSKNNGLFSYVKLKMELSEILAKNVDLVTEASISPHLRECILHETKVLYSAEG